MEHENEEQQYTAAGPPAEARSGAKGIRKYWPVIAVPLVIAALVGVYFMGASKSNAELEAAQQAAAEAQAELGKRPAVGSDGRIGYASNVVATDPETLQTMVDEMYEKSKEPGVALEYKNLMVSDDGINFTCYIGNSANNAYDMFITIYGDQELTDELYLSELMRPGTRFEEIKFLRKLEPGEHTGYIVYTQVDDEENQVAGKPVLQQVIHAQVATTIQIVVNG